MKSFSIIQIILYVVVKFNHGLILEGQVETIQDWLFVGKFCFLPDVGRIELNFSYPFDYRDLSIALYYDEQWPQVYPNKEMTCSQKLNHVPTQVIATQNECEFSYASSSTIKCGLSRKFIGQRSYYWFIVFSRCSTINSTHNGIFVKYLFTMTNGNGYFQKHFSADEMGILETSIFMFIFYSLLTLTTLVYARILALKRLLHTTFKLFLTSILIQLFSIMLTMIDYCRLAETGKFQPGLTLVGRLCNAISSIIFLLMLILLAKGYTVTRGKLRTVTAIKITVLLVVYTVAYAVVFIYSEVLFDPGLVNYHYSSPAGTALIVIKLVFGWFWFVYSIFFTIKNYPEKRMFYIPFAIYYTLWFFIDPTVILVCNYIVNMWARQKTGFIVQLCVTTMGFLYFLVLTYPSKTNENFPFHVTTTSVGVASEENFPHHEEDEGGNTKFDENLKIQNLFVTQDSREKYVVSQEENT